MVPGRLLKKTVTNILFLSFLFMHTLFSLKNPVGAAPAPNTDSNDFTETLLPVADHGIPEGKKNRGVAVTIFTPSNVRGNILVLPGWKYSRKRWLKETPLVAEARKHGFRLICPEMNTTLYESSYFPETTLKWQVTPGLEWIQGILIPRLQEQEILKKGDSNFLLGLSTGGRGVAQIALALPDLFQGGAALSGDFDQTLDPGDRLMSAIYGPYARFHERWQEVDNPGKRVKEWSMPIYLAHSKQDRVVPFRQTELMYQRLKETHPDLDVEFFAVNGGHNFVFWSSQTAPALEFFEKQMSNK